MNAQSATWQQARQQAIQFASRIGLNFGGGATDSSVSDEAFNMVVSEQGFSENIRRGNNSRQIRSSDSSDGWRTHLVNAVQNLSGIGLVPPQIALA